MQAHIRGFLPRGSYPYSRGTIEVLWWSFCLLAYLENHTAEFYQIFFRFSGIFPSYRVYVFNFFLSCTRLQNYTIGASLLLGIRIRIPKSNILLGEYVS